MKKTLIILLFSLLYSTAGMTQNHKDTLLKIRIGLEAGPLFSQLIGGHQYRDVSAACNDEYYLTNNFGTGANLGLFTEIHRRKMFAFRIGVDYDLLVNKIKYKCYYHFIGGESDEIANYYLYSSLARLSFAPTVYFAHSRLFISLGLNRRFSLKKLSYINGYINSHSQAYLGMDSVYHPESYSTQRNKDILNSLTFTNTFGFFFRCGGQIFKNNEHLKLELTVYDLYGQDKITQIPYKNISGTLNLSYLIKK